MVGGGGGEGRAQQGERLVLCCSFVVIIGNMEWILFSRDTAGTFQPATPRQHSLKISTLRLKAQTESGSFFRNFCLTVFLRSVLQESPGAEVCFVGNQSDDDRTISC